MAEIFNRLDAGSSKEILTNIEVGDPSLVETVRHLMFVFEISDGRWQRDQEILSRVDRKMLTLALKGTSDNAQPLRATCRLAVRKCCERKWTRWV